MSCNYSILSLKTSIEELDISPGVLAALKKAGITNVAELLSKASELPKSGKLPRGQKIIKQVASMVYDKRPDLMSDLESAHAKKFRRNINIDTGIDILDLPEEVKQELKNARIRTLRELIEYNTIDKLRAQGIRDISKIKKILKALTDLCALVPELKVRIDKNNLRIEEERKSFSQLLIKDLMWLTPNVRECLNLIDVKTLGEFANVIKDNFRGVDIESGKILETLKYARRIEMWLNDERALNIISSPDGSSKFPINIKYYAPWWIKALHDVGIYGIRGIIECGGEYGLEKKGISRKDIYGIWSATIEFCKTSPELQNEMDKKEKERLEQKEKYKSVPIFALRDLPESVLRVIEFLHIKTVGELLEVENSDFEKLIGSSGFKTIKVDNYIKRLEVYCDNSELEELLVAEYVFTGNEKKRVEIDRKLLEDEDIEVPETEIERLSKRKRALRNKENDFLCKTAYLRRKFRVINFKKDK